MADEKPFRFLLVPQPMKTTQFQWALIGAGSMLAITWYLYVETFLASGAFGLVRILGAAAGIILAIITMWALLGFRRQGRADGEWDSRAFFVVILAFLLFAVLRELVDAGAREAYLQTLGAVLTGIFIALAVDPQAQGRES